MFSLLGKNYINKFSKQLLVVVESATNLNFLERLKTPNRALSTTSLAGATDYKVDRREFMAILPDLVSNLTEYASKYESKDAVKLYEMALQYNLTPDQQIIGITTVLMYKELADKTQLDSENLRLAHYLGWCVELMQCTFFIHDDIMDGSVTRRGQPCWHNLEEIGLTAVNDSLMIENGIYHILKENFEKKDYYVKLLELFHEIFFMGTIGQSMDVQSSKICVTSFTMDRYKTIIANKASAFLYLPIELAMHLCGFTDPEVFRQTRNILHEISSYFQIENDFKDCFGDPGKTGKIGNDIQENKCTWLAVVCMEKASEAQKEIMRECYGKTDPVKIARVKHLYEELGLQNIYTAYKEETINRIKARIQQDSGSIVEQLYRVFLPFYNAKNFSDAFESSCTSI